MGKKIKRDNRGVVYSTNPDYQPQTVGDLFSNDPKNNQAVKVIPEKKGRGGKTVTLIKGIEANAFDLADIAKTLKQKCGVGGSLKDNVILIQGDHVDRIVTYLKDMGYKQAKRAGG